jgi:hypothetical protein
MMKKLALIIVEILLCCIYTQRDEAISGVKLKNAVSPQRKEDIAFLC